MCQNSTKLFGTDSMFVGTGGSMSIWGNFYNAGNSGTGGSLVIKSNGFIKMYGDTLQNIGASQIAGTGSFEMIRPRPAPYATSSDQIIISGGPTVSLSNFIVNTTSSIQLKNYDLKIRDTLKFISGCIVLNNNDLIVGNGNAGVITGYNENSFVVTNNHTRDTLKGFLKREQVGATSTVFPIGQAIGDYTPAMIQNTGTTDDFKVRVFDSVYEDGYVENIFSPSSVPASFRSVQRTWDIREGTKGGSNVNLTLQYNSATESSIFANNRSYAFISHFTGIAPNVGGDTTSNSKWDLFKRSSTSTPTDTGTLTTGSAITSAAMKTRSGITSFSPFSITTWFPGATPLPIQLISFDAKWRNTMDAELNWQVANPELVASIDLERSIDNQAFETVESFIGSANISAYRSIDLNIANRIGTQVIYRLKLIEDNGTISYSSKKQLRKNGSVLPSDISIYPSPANGSLHIESQIFEDDEPVQIQIVNSVGQIVMEITVENRIGNSFKQTLSIESLKSGIYQLNIKSGNININKKLLISH